MHQFKAKMPKIFPSVQLNRVGYVCMCRPMLFDKDVTQCFVDRPTGLPGLFCDCRPIHYYNDNNK